jgi:glucosamine-6-phosphate deaminase
MTVRPLGRDLNDMLPFVDKRICAEVRAVSREDVTRRSPAHHPEFRVRVIETPEELYSALAEDMLARIAQARAAGRPFVGLFPVGPVGQYGRLRERVAPGGARFDHCQIFFLDEYANEDGQAIDPSSPWSFRRVAKEEFVQPLAPLGLRGEQVHFPGPDNVERYDEMVLDLAGGAGADVVYGGIGWSGHFAFWEPHLAEEFASDADWRRAHSALVRLHPMSRLHNSLRAGGDWSSVPPCAHTVGPALVLGARYRSFWLDADLGSGMSWQRFVGRLAVQGPVTPRVPASYLQTLPGEVVFLGSVAEPIGGPRTSWR